MNNSTLIGRKKEQEILKKALESPEAEMISVIGRRRVGKTFLVKSVYEHQIDFELTGLLKATRSTQLRSFANRLKAHAPSTLVSEPPSDWLGAFFLLINYLEQKDKKGKLIVFFDELPWLATRKSGFLTGLDFFWNSWAVNQKIVVVLCGSAASWMIRKVVNNTGGLYNRLTKRIILKPFTLEETEQYLRTKNITLNRYHIIQLYMALGGIPHYLKEIEPGKSAAQNIDDICFADTGILQDEFTNLYPALFEHWENHISVVRALAQKRLGLHRDEIIKTAQLPNGGSLTKVLEELTQSGFISVYRPFGKKKKNKLYRLTDEFSLFYLQFMEDMDEGGTETWQHFSQTQKYKVWSGYTFESICLKHLPQIKKALSIAGIYSKSSSFFKKGTDQGKGAQIDLLLDRNDHVINLFEIKFHKEEFTISKAYADNLRNKQRIFRETTKTRKHLSWVFITTFGLKVNQHSLGMIEKILTLDDLFAYG